MKVILLTPEQQRTIDPTNRVRSRLASFRHDLREPLPTHVTTKVAPTEWIQQYHARTAHLCPEPYRAIQVDNVDKVGRQGGTFPLDQLQQLILPYYQKARSATTLHPDLYRARDYLLQLIREKIEQVGGPQFYDFKADTKHTAAALPTGGRKGTFDSETIGFKPWRHASPIVPGERFMRNKPRSIFMMANPDFRYQEREFTVTRNWLKQHFPEYFSAWVHPTLIADNIHRILRKSFVSVEEDYVSMDVNYTLRVVEELIAPIYELLLGPRFTRWMAFVEESFSCPLYWGDRLWTGEHSLFSGLTYTNDFETIFSVIMMLASTLATRKIASFDSETLMLALGDDLTLAGRFSQARALKMHRLHLEYAASAQMILHDDEKARISHSDLRFLRRVYWKGGPYLGAYPSVLTLNNILQPEYTQPTTPMAVLADLQRLDGLWGAPDWEAVIRIYAKLLTQEGRSALLSEAITTLKLEQDWWDKLYGEAYVPMTGPSFELLRSFVS